MITGKTNVVFENISFKINQNEVVSLLGSNGAGKSTLMDIIVGFKQATSGTVTYGIKFDRTPTEKIGVSFQKNIFLDSLTV
jgi:ABC-type multidrug transport system ATPase subunit